MKKTKNDRILKQNAAPSELRINGAGLIFKVDNDPKIAPNYADDFLNEKQVKVF